MSESEIERRQSQIDTEITHLQFSLDLCDDCSPTSDVSDLTLTPCSEENSLDSATSRRSPRSPRTPGTPESYSSKSNRSSATLFSIQKSIKSSESIRSSESSESVKARQACIFMIETMLRVFPEREGFFVNDDYNEDNFDEMLIEFFVFKNEVGKEAELCLIFNFDPDDIYIERALTSKCGDVTGTDLLNKMGMVFLILRERYPHVIMKIRLDEAELKFLGIKRSLSWLYLFKSGESWYNSKGYYEDKGENKLNYNKNKVLIDKFIHQKVVVAYNEEELDLISSILGSISDQETIQTLFIKICDILKMKKEEEEEKCCACIELLNLTITKFIEFLKGDPGNNFMCTKFYQLYYKPTPEIIAYLMPMIEVEGVGVGVEEREKGGRKTRKRRVIKRKNTRKRNKKSMKKRKGKKTIKKRTKKHKNF